MNLSTSIATLALLRDRLAELDAVIECFPGIRIEVLGFSQEFTGAVYPSEITGDRMHRMVTCKVPHGFLRVEQLREQRAALAKLIAAFTPQEAA